MFSIIKCHIEITPTTFLILSKLDPLAHHYLEHKQNVTHSILFSREMILTLMTKAITLYIQ